MSTRCPSSATRLSAMSCLALLLTFSLVSGATAATYQKIRVEVTPETPMTELFFHPDLELMNDDDGALILLSRPDLTAELEARGFAPEVLIEDLEAFYVARLSGTRDYGVWHTYAEMIAEMNAIHADYPSLTTAPASLGTSHEGRDLWAMKVSDNPELQEDEPEVLFDGVHHAREIMALEIPLFFCRYLCENYGVDPVLTFIVDNRQIWFVPMVNPDGFVYNETTNPNGGGMWRKNRRINQGSSCIGVDPNRNYPFEWVGPGSSTDPCNDTYRGPSAGSEPEIAAHMNFINQHEFVTWNSYHSVVGCVLIPWAYVNQPTPDDPTFRRLAAEMTRYNGYDYGTCYEMINYTVNGGSMDWGYDDSGQHPKIYSVSTEVGGSDFWPQQSEREGLIEENIHADITLCLAAGACALLEDVAVSEPGGNGHFDPGEAGSLVPTVYNLGVEATAEDVIATLLCDDPYVSLTDAAIAIGDIPAGESVTASADPFDLTIDPTCPEGREVTFTIRLTAAGGFLMENTIALMIGQAPVLYGNDFEAAGDAWVADPTHSASTGDFVRIDPVQTEFQPGDDTTPTGTYAWITAQNPSGNVGVDDVDGGTSATRSPVIDLSGATHVRLHTSYFCGQRDIGDDSGDFIRIDVSNDGGASFPVRLVDVGDVNHSAQWLTLSVDLEELLALTAEMVVRIQAADGTSTGDIVEAGIDDFYLFDRGDGNEPPAAPVLLDPPPGATGLTSTPTLTVENAIDPEGDDLTYGFRVYSDAELTQLVAEVNDIAEGTGGTTSWTVNPPLAQATYFWRAFAADEAARGLYAPAQSFTVTDVSGVAENGRSGLRLTASPNPAPGEVSIRYYTPAAPFARLEIYDAGGRRVRTLAAERWKEGWQELRWDGRDDQGISLAGGVFWVKLVLPEESRTVRVIRMK